MVEHAQNRAQTANLDNVYFQHGSLAPTEILGTFDLVVGRFVAIFQPDLIGFIRRAASLVKPGGTIVFIEPGWNITATWTSPTIPAYDALIASMVRTIQKLGTATGIGAGLVGSFIEAGLGEPAVSAEFLVGGPASGLSDYNIMNSEIIFNQARQAGLDVPGQAELETVAALIRQEAGAKHVQFNGPCIVGAWAKVG